MKNLHQHRKFHHFTTAILLHFFAYLIVFTQFDVSNASKFNPSVKVRTQELGPEPATGSDKSSSSESTVSKSKNCAGVNCMPQPVPAPGSPECKPRRDAGSCCPTWICASDDILAKSLFDKDNNWNVKHDQYEDLFDIDEDDHHDDHHDDFPPPSASEPKSGDKNENFERYVKNGKLDNRHNKNFLNRLQHEEPAKGNGPSIANNYANFKRMLNNAKIKGSTVETKSDDSDSGNKFSDF